MDLTRRQLMEMPLVQPAEQTPRPNILWICTDQQRWDTLASLGNRFIRTPILDRLAREGVAFTRAYCQSPICTPSRASFLTGCRPATIGQHRNGNERFPAEISSRLVTRQLAGAGYDCGLIGKLHISSPWQRPEPRVDDGYRSFEWSHHPKPETFWPLADHAYQRWLRDRKVDWKAIYRRSKIPGYPDPFQAGMPAEHHEIAWTVERAIHFMERGARAPWLLSANIFAPHPPFDPAPEYLRRMDPDSMPLPIYTPGEEESQKPFAAIDHQTQTARSPESYDARRMKASYYAMIEHVDWAVGAMLDSLDRTNQRNNTFIIFTSDHGDMLGDHGLLNKGCRFFEGAVRVPLIFSWPGGGLRRGVVSDSLVELSDIAPTLLEASGVSSSQPSDGRSLLSLLRGSAGATRARETVISEYFDALEMPDHTRASMIRDSRYKLVIYHGRPLGELYDLSEDPLETRNLFSDLTRRGVRAGLTAQLLDSMCMAAPLGARRIGRY